MPPIRPKRPSVPDCWTFDGGLGILGMTRGEGTLLKVEVQIDPGLDGPEIILRAPMPTAEVEELARKLRESALPGPFTVYAEREAVRVSRAMVLRFYAEDKGVFCQTAQGVYTVRQRLYELEEELAGTKFVRVSNSEIVNLDRVAALDLTLAGTIKMTLEGGTVCWVSRRYVKKIKQALGL